MSAQPKPIVVPLGDIKDVRGFCIKELKRLTPGMFFQPDQREDEIQHAVEYLLKMHAQWDRTRTTGTFEEHAKFQMRRYYVRGRLPVRREREGRETTHVEEDLASVGTPSAAAERSFWEADQRIYAAQVEVLMANRELSEFDREIVCGILRGVKKSHLAPALGVTRSTVDAHLERLQPHFREFFDC